MTETLHSEAPLGAVIHFMTVCDVASGILVHES